MRRNILIVVVMSLILEAVLKLIKVVIGEALNESSQSE